MEKQGFKCVICEAWVMGYGSLKQYGNNPQPLAKNGECCDKCNELVIKARINQKIVKLINEVKVTELFMRAEKVDFNKDIDESYAGGFWDLAYEIAVDVFGTYSIHVDTQTRIYEGLWVRYEQEKVNEKKEDK